MSRTKQFLEECIEQVMLICDRENIPCTEELAIDILMETPQFVKCCDYEEMLDCIMGYFTRHQYTNFIK